MNPHGLMQGDMILNPRLIHFPKIGNSGQGFISVAEYQNLPFEVKRVYWTYYTPEDVQRGGHSHYELEQILIAVAGKVIVKLEQYNGMKSEYILDSPANGLYIPKATWRTLQYTHNAVQVCLASMTYSEDDYIRQYETFKAIQK